MSDTLDDDVTVGPETLQASVRIADDRWNDIQPVAIADMVMTAIAASSCAPLGNAMCDIVFSDDAELHELNRRFLDKDRPTNVLAFPSGDLCGPGTPCNLGGIVVSYDRVDAEARERGISMTDHTTHLTLHGMLHLLGYDHESEAERAEMERIEINLLSGLGVADPYEGS